MAVAKRSTSSARGKKKATKTSKGTSKKVAAVAEENEVVEQAAEAVLDGTHFSEEPSLEASESTDEAAANSETTDKTAEPIKTRLSDEYLIQCYFDKTQNQFVATVLEMGQIKAVGSSKADVIRDCENRLESHLNLLKRQGESVPETFQSRHYPETLQVPVSQGLYRRLDLLSRQEKISLDDLVVELISGMVERRLQTTTKHHGQNHGHRSHQHSHQGGHRDSHRNDHRREQHKNDGQRDARRENAPRDTQRDGHRDGRREPQRDGQKDNQRDFMADNDNIGNLKREPQQSQQNRHNRGRGGRNFHKTMESRENFLEYVRNLEKGNWKKR